jgi:hypothetical protein
MSISQQDIQQIKAILIPAIGQKAWGSRLVSVGSFMTIEFGNPVPAEWDPSHLCGTWSLLTDMCDWRLEKNEAIILGSEDHRSRIGRALQNLDGLILLDVDIQSPAFDTIFVFNKKISFRIFPTAFINETYSCPSAENFAKS